MYEPEKLITEYSYELSDDHHHPGSGRYGLAIKLTEDISPAFPYLNAVLEDTQFDQHSGVLIGASDRKRYAFRPHQIHLGMIADTSEVPARIGEVVELINKVWADRANITPDYKEREKPPVFEVYKLLPGSNCRKCGYSTCLACAADLRNGLVTLEICPLLEEPENGEKRERVLTLLFQGNQQREISGKSP